MKILYIITQGEEGGAQRHVRDLAIEMTAKGHEISVATGGQALGNEDVWLFRQVHKVVKSEQRYVIENLKRDISLRDWKGFLEMVKVIKEVSPDVVHVHSSKAGILGSMAGWWAGVPVIYTVHGFVFNEPMGKLKKIFYVFAEWFASWFRAHTIILCDKDGIVGDRFQLLPANRSSIVYNGIDPLLKQNFFSREEAQMEIKRFAPHVKFSRFVFGTIGNLYETKGLNYYLQALAIIKKTHKDVQAIIIGEGPERAHLTAQKSRLDLEDNVSFVGSIPDAYRVLRAFDCFVLPSVKEGAPYVLLEAALSGIPSVATDVGGVTEIADKAGCITTVPPKNPKALAEVLTGILEYGKPIETNKEWHPALTLAMMARATENVYKQVLKEQR